MRERLLETEMKVRGITIEQIKIDNLGALHAVVLIDEVQFGEIQATYSSHPNKRTYMTYGNNPDLTVYANHRFESLVEASMVLPEVRRRMREFL